LIDIAVPGDTRVKEKEQEKVDKCQKLAGELKRVWKVNTNKIPTVVGALGTTPKTPKKIPKRAGTTASIELLKLHSWKQHKYSKKYYCRYWIL